MRSRNAMVAVVAFVLLLTACNSAAEETTTTAPAVTTTTTTQPPTTTRPPTTTTSTTTEPPTTTSTEPPQLIAATGELPEELLDRVGELYSWLADKRNPQPAVQRAMALGMSSVSRRQTESVIAEGTLESFERSVEREQEDGSVETVTETHQVGVVHVGDDLLFVSADPEWEVVGFHAEDATWLSDGPMWLLVLGSDARPGQNQQRFRADSIHILAFQPNQLRGSIVGFPRDAYVEGPIRGFDKFTHHMASAGPEVMLEVATNLTDIPIHGYAVTGFVGFENLISALGGLRIDLPRSVNTGNGWDNFKSGLQTLGSRRALQLARARKGVPGGDFGRSANQGLIMQAIMDMVQTVGIDTMPGFAGELLDHAWSDVPTDELVIFAAMGYLIDSNDLHNVVIPGRAGFAGSKSVVFLADRAEDIYRDLDDGWLDDPDF